MLCSRCRTDQPRDEFGPSADQWPSHRQCKTCNRDGRMLRKHGLTAADKELIAKAQGGCRICGHSEPSAKGWVIDHDRSCCPGEKSCPSCRRGVICQWCNSVLGNAFDRPQILRAAADYLECSEQCAWHMPVACAPSICNAHLLSNARGDATYVEDERTNADGAGLEGNPAPNASRARSATHSSSATLDRATGTP